MPLKITTLNIPDQYLDCIEVLVQLKYFPSRSEAFREAIKQFLVNETQNKKEFDPAFFKDIKQKQMEQMIS